MQEAELRRVFALVDRDRCGAVSRDDFELLLMSMGFNLSPSAIDGCIGEIFAFCPEHCNAGDNVTFNAFAVWWMDKDSMFLYSKKK